MTDAYMPPHDRLALRAMRMLKDGYRHSPQALEWAQWMAPDRVVAKDVNTLLGAGFSLREISLGSREVVSL